MKRVATACVLSVLLAAPAGRAAAKPSGDEAPPPATQAGVLALADKYLAIAVPRLPLDGKTAIDQMTFTLEAQRRVPSVFAKSVDELVNRSTLALAKKDGMDAVVVVSAHLVKLAPKNPRTANLIGVVLHALGEDDEALAALEYARTLNPKSELVRLNMASIHLGRGEDEKAKALLDEVVAQNDANKSAWAALATYWYRKGDIRKTADALVKSAKFGGFKKRKKALENRKVIEPNEVTGGDSIEAAEKKLDAVKDLVPKTTADVIEDAFPDAARRIRDATGKLLDAEKMIMPRLPQVNVSGVRGWKAQGNPYMERWALAFAANAKKAHLEIARLQTGIEPGDSKEVKKAKGKAAAQKQIQKAMADAQEMLARMEGMPGMSPAQVAQIRARMEETMRKKGIAPPPPAPSGEGAPGPGQGGDPDALPGFDHGSMFAATNYRDYLLIRNGYELYFQKYYEKFRADVGAITHAYGVKRQEEMDLYEQNLLQIAQRERAEYCSHGSSEGAGGVYFDCDGPLPDLDGVPDEMASIEVRREKLRHKKALNALADDFFAQWVHYVLPQYERKMKPMLDQFWATCGLYVRNMNDPEILKAEYARVKQTFWTYGMMAVSSVGGDWEWEGETDTEERQLEADLAQAKEDAKAREEGYRRDTKAADDAYVKWLEDNLAIGIAGEFLSVKVTPRQIIVEEYIAGMNFKHVLDFKTGNWTTERGFAAKLDVGIQVGPIKAGVSARADFLTSYDTYNFGSGKLVDCGSRFAQATADTSVGVGPVTAGGGVEVALDPAAETELSAKFTKNLDAGFGNLSDLL